MGLSSSKFGKQIHEDELQEGSVPSTPILTPKSKTNTNADPRSPSTHISRTPLELLSAVSEKLESLEEQESTVFGNDNNVILELDPRSPTTDFTRTPIILSVKESCPKKLYNKNLDKVRQTELHTPKSSTEKTFDKKSVQIIPPKLLDSSPMKPRLETCKRKSLVGLLETNLDFTETDLDDVFMEKCKIEQPANTHNMIESIDPRSPTIDFERTPIHINRRGEEIVESRERTENEECFSDCDKDQSENISTEQSENAIIDQNVADEVKCGSQNGDLSYIENDSEIIDIAQPADTQNEVESKSAPVTPPTEVRPISEANISKSAPVTPPLVDITANVKELDKKLTNLIYEDEDIVVCPRIVKLKDHAVRSPLRNCNGNEPVKIQKLKVSDKPRKSDYAVSKIPVFKDKVRREDIQCENTPPRNRENRRVKFKKSAWDNGDNTLYI